MLKKLFLIICTLTFTIPVVYAELADKPIEFNSNGQEVKEQSLTNDYLYKNSQEGGLSAQDYSLKTTPVPVNMKARRVLRETGNTPEPASAKSTPMNYNNFPKNYTDVDSRLLIPNASGDMFNILY